MAAGLETASSSTIPVLESGIIGAKSVKYTSTTPPDYSGASEDEARAENHWEEIPSLASSFPSLSETPASSSPEKTSITGENRQRPLHDDLAIDDIDLPPHPSTHHHHHHHSSHRPHQPEPKVVTPPSLTTAIFAPGITPRARVLALFSSLAINMFLPFVNGVMLGFGEIFARNVVGPLFGWKAPSVAGVGLRAPTKAEEPKRRK